MLDESLNVFRQIMAILCCLFGLPGNILTIIVCIKAFYHRKINFERRVFDLYLIEISILDTCLLLYWVIDTFISYLYSINKTEFFSLMHISAFSCYFSFLINRLCAALCSWLITCFTLIRFINIFRQFNTIKSNIILLSSLFVIFSIANSYSIIVLEYDAGKKQRINESLIKENSTLLDYRIRCSIRPKYANDNFILLMNTLVAGVLNLALPSILILIVNIAILCFIKRIHTTQTHDTVNRRSDVTNYRSTLSTLLVISITYTLVYVPYCIFYLLRISFDDESRILHYSSEIAYILRFVSHSVNFYAYIFTNLRFRRDILILLNYLCRPCFYFKKRHQYKRQKRSQLIILDKCRLPPPLPIDSSKNGKYQRTEDVLDQNPIDLKQQQEEQNLI